MHTLSVSNQVFSYTRSRSKSEICVSWSLTAPVVLKAAMPHSPIIIRFVCVSALKDSTLLWGTLAAQTRRLPVGGFRRAGLGSKRSFVKGQASCIWAFKVQLRGPIWGLGDYLVRGCGVLSSLLLTSTNAAVPHKRPATSTRLVRSRVYEVKSIYNRDHQRAYIDALLDHDAWASTGIETSCNDIKRLTPAIVPAPLAVGKCRLKM